MEKPDCTECIYEYFCDWSPNEEDGCKMFRKAKDAD